MNLRKTLIAVALLALPLAAVIPSESGRVTAQTGLATGQEMDDGAKRHFRFGFVFIYEQTRDDLLVPLRWGGPGFGIKAEWGPGRGRAGGHLRALIPVNYVQNRYGHPGASIGWRFSYRYLVETEATPLGGRLSLGGQIRRDVYHGVYFSWDDEHDYWLASYSLGPALGWRRGGDRRVRLAAELDFPVLALVSRPPLNYLNKKDPMMVPSFYFSAIQRDKAFATPPEYLALHAGFLVEQNLGGSAIALLYDLDLVRYDGPEPVITVAHRFSIARRIW